MYLKWVWIRENNLFYLCLLTFDVSLYGARPELADVSENEILHCSSVLLRFLGHKRLLFKRYIQRIGF